MAVSLADGERQYLSGGHLFLVADGMGAHAAGELASQIAADNIPHAFRKRRELAPCEAIVAAVQDANSRIFSKGQNSVDFQGMGTTCSCLVLLEDGALAAHVGDSRVYRLRKGVLEQLTFDHSLVWEMAAAGEASEEQIPAYVPKNVITRSLGPHATVKVDLEGPLPIAAGDRYLLCSDGLTGPLSPELIGMVLDALPPDDAAQTLVDLANLLGGPDNITVLTVEVSSPALLGQTESCELPGDLLPSGSASVSRITLASLAACGAAAAIAAALAAGDYFVAAAAVGASSLGLGLWGLVRWVAERQGFAAQGVRGKYGKGPYRSYRVRPDAERIGTLAEIVRQLEDLESQRHWDFDWKEIHDQRQKAYAAITHGDFQAAVVSYSSAVRILMKAVREFRPEPPSDSSINLGED